MGELEKLKESANALTLALDAATGGEHHFSKEIRRFFKNYNFPHRETVLKFRHMIDHDDGLLDSIDNELIQLCYPDNSEEAETLRVEQFITLLTSKTEFVKRLFLISNSSLIGFK